MTSYARRGQGGVVVIRVALGALHTGVSARQRDCRGTVIEARGLPAARRVADRAVGREAGRHMIGTRCRREVTLMAGITVCWRRDVVVVRVALNAACDRVHTRERIMRIKSVIELGGQPVSRRVAGSAFVG